LERESTIRGGLTGSNPKLVFHAFNYHLGVFKIAGQAFANPDYIPAQRLGREKRIEGGYPKYLTYRKAQRLSYIGEEFIRQVTIFFLCSL